MKLDVAISIAALAAAKWLLVPLPDAYAFDKLGSSIGLGQRDVRVFDNFVDAKANDNTVQVHEFPGATGADLAIWKSVVEWQSLPHGDGGGDPTQAVLGDGGANFDPAWCGAADGVGGPEDNVESAISACVEGLYAYTETSLSSGWRIRFCDKNLTWDDGPGAIASQDFDLQGIACHEYGHALGLAHSSEFTATMAPGGFPGTTDYRSIEADDIAGVQCIYGVRSATKPTITSAVAKGGLVATSVVVKGAGFALVNNDLWFTPRSDTRAGRDPRVRILNLDSTSGGTRIDVLLPAWGRAGHGDVLVHVPGNGGATLSNAFPIAFP